MTVLHPKNAFGILLCSYPSHEDKPYKKIKVDDLPTGILSGAISNLLGWFRPEHLFLSFAFTMKNKAQNESPGLTPHICMG